MGKRSRRERSANGLAEDGRPRSVTASDVRPASAARVRILQAIVTAVTVAVAVFLLVASRDSTLFRSMRGPGTSGNTGSENSRGLTFTRVGRNGPVFTISVPRQNAGIDDQLMKIAEQLSAEEAQAGGSGQVSVMVWPDDVAVPKEPPTTEFDASMKTQVAGIFINPKLNVKHLIRFKDGATVSERDFGKPTR
jgi:hypothetical protein